MQRPRSSDWLSYRDRLGELSGALRDCLPDALVISPPKTGTTWLFARLREHPNFFLPEQKEIRYFCEKWRFRNLDWYAGEFAAGRAKIKVDVSPSYAILPRPAIRAIREIHPEIKLIFLMRDPVSRAWSHAKHMCIYGEGNFCNASLPVPEVDAGQWARNFIHDWPLAYGTYADCLNRWLEYFPKPQIYIGFYEDIASAPMRVLEGVCRFLDTPVFDWPVAGLAQRVFEGSPEIATEDQIAQLRFVLRRRTEETRVFLEQEFALQLPPEWSTTLAGPELDGAYPETGMYSGNRIVYDGRFFRTSGSRETELRASMLEELRIMLDAPRAEIGPDAEDTALQRALDSVLAPEAAEDQAHAGLQRGAISGPENSPVLVGHYRGFNLVLYKNRAFALRNSLGQVNADVREVELEARFGRQNVCFAGNLDDVKAHVDVVELSRDFAALAAELERARSRTESLLTAQQREVDGLREQVTVLQQTLGTVGMQAREALAHGKELSRSLNQHSTAGHDLAERLQLLESRARAHTASSADAADRLQALESHAHLQSTLSAETTERQKARLNELYTTLEDLRNAMKSIAGKEQLLARQFSLLQYGPGEPDIPCVGGEHRGFSLVHYQGRVYGLRKPVEPAEVRRGETELLAQHGAANVVTGESADGVRSRIDVLEDLRELHAELAAERETLVTRSEWFAALAPLQRTFEDHSRMLERLRRSRLSRLLGLLPREQK